MPSISYFTTTSILEQSVDKAYGISSNVNKFNVSSSFTSNGTENVYAAIGGTILLQQQSDVNKVNLILRPHEQKDLKLPIKYIIYRGLKTLDFLNSTNITDPANQVKTSGSELLVEMQTIQTQRASGTPIPVEALFGNELSPSATKKIDEFFYKSLSASSQLFTISCGTELGKFANGDVSIEIILENPEFFVNVENAKKAKYEIDVTSISDPAKKKWTQDLVRHFIDPAAFYGFHHDISGGIEYRQGINKLIANTPVLVYQNIVNKFFTKNKVYLDIRNENGYSYNYYNNYKGTGADANKNIQIGQSAGTLVSKEYNTNGWANHIVNVTPGTTAENEIFLSLRVNDNERPLLAGWSVLVTPNTVVDPPLGNQVAKRVYFTDETQLLPTPIPNVLPNFTNTVSIKIPNVSGGTPVQLATMIKLDYIKQLMPLSSSNIFKKQNLTDYLFGPLDSNIPWDLENKVQWFTSDHVTYVDALNDGYVVGKYKTTILSFNNTSNEIEIFDEVPVDVSQSIMIENTASNNQNVGTYTIAGIRNINGKTFIKLKENLPSGALQTGDKATLSVKIDGSIDLTTNKFIVKNKNYVNLEVLSLDNRLNFYSRYGFSNSYDVSGNTYQNPNTEIQFATSKSKIGLAGFATTGIVLETTTSTTSPDDDRVIYYASPLNYFSTNGITKSSNFNAKGGALNYESLLKGLEAIMPGVTIKKTKLAVGSDSILTFSYDSKSKAKEALFLLGLTKAEWQTAKTNSSALSENHIKLFKLIGNGQSQTDKNKNVYYQYELIVSGLDAGGVHKDVNTGISIYTIDHLIFSSKNFASKYDINTTLAEQSLLQFINEILTGTGSELTNLNVSREEEIQLKKTLLWGSTATSPKLIKTNKELFDLAPSGTTTFKTIINGLKESLDNVQPDKASIENVLKLKGSELIKYAKQIIREKDASGTYKPYANRDGILYLSRLICLIIIKNHPLLLSKFPNNIQELYDLFEKSSRGLNVGSTSYPNFSTYFNPANFNNEMAAPLGSKKILITGFDPFGAGADEDGYNSNPAGNIALALDGVKITNGAKNAIVRTAIFPVRYREFNRGWVEQFVTPFISSVDMIITVSYGTHYSKTNDHGFHIDRFAAKTRAKSTDNNQYPYDYDNNDYGYLQDPYGKAYLEKNDRPFILNKLPIEKLLNSSNKISVPKTNIVVNYGNNTLGALKWKVLGKRKAHTIGTGNSTVNVPLGSEIDYTTLFAAPPYVGFPNYFANIDKANSGGDIEMRFESDEKKYFTPKPDLSANPPIVNNDYIPNITWDAFKDLGMEVDYQDFRIKAENGSGGGYLSNEIHYRVAYLRETIKNTLPNGHIHIGFLSDDNYQSRKDMMDDIKHILEKFLEAL